LIHVLKRLTTTVEGVTHIDPSYYHERSDDADSYGRFMSPDDDDGNDNDIYTDDNSEVESEKGVDDCEDNADGNDEDND